VVPRRWTLYVSADALDNDIGLEVDGGHDDGANIYLSITQAKDLVSRIREAIAWLEDQGPKEAL
jgi:hypothetical protein